MKGFFVQRLAGRRACRACGRGYNVVFDPPQRDGVCDVCDKTPGGVACGAGSFPGNPEVCGDGIKTANLFVIRDGKVMELEQ